QRWRAEPSVYLLMPQDIRRVRGLPEDMLRQEYPLTLRYLLNFRDELERRALYRKFFCKEIKIKGKASFAPLAPFYSMYNIREYTITSYKVCWREQAQWLTGAVVGSAKLVRENKVVVPDHKLMSVSFDDEEEAHYVCAVLNSSISTLVVKSYTIQTSTSTHV